MDRMDEQTEVLGDYLCIKALENGVTIIGLTRGRDTRLHHTEKLDKGEVMFAQFTDITSAIKIRGRAMVMSKLGVVYSGDEEKTEAPPSPSGSRG
jgi:transcription attenuation protein (tryptophan RNA-binding attenuator protein)